MSTDKTNEFTYEQFVEMCEQAGIGSDNKAEIENDYRVGAAIADVVKELEKATEKFPPMNSAHEGFAILKEEVDELWEVVRQKASERDVAKMRAEAVQVAAMAIRFIGDVCNVTTSDN